MIEEEKKIITDLKKCNFNEILAHYKLKSEERKAMSKEDKKVTGIAFRYLFPYSVFTCC
jgi:DNA topoisomerase-1